MEEIKPGTDKKNCLYYQSSCGKQALEKAPAPAG